jgi:hypothetical protein
MGCPDAGDEGGEGVEVVDQEPHGGLQAMLRLFCANAVSPRLWLAAEDAGFKWQASAVPAFSAVVNGCRQIVRVFRGICGRDPYPRPESMALIPGLDPDPDPDSDPLLGPPRGDRTTPGKSPGVDTNLPETNGGSSARFGAGGCAMKQAVPYLGRFLSKFVFEIIPGAIVSVLAAYFLSMLHIARGAEPVVVSADPPSVTVMQSDGLSADQRRELTRQMLKERRENPEEPAEVKPMPSLRPTAPPPETADLAPVAPQMAAPQIAAPPVAAPQVAAPQVAAPQIAVPEVKPAEVKLPEAKPEPKPRPEAVRPAVAAATPVTPLPRAPAPRVRTEPAPIAAAPSAGPSVTASLPPAPGAAPLPSGATPLPAVTVNAPPPDAPAEPPRRGFVGNVFSGISTIAGGAANATGNTVNWVIDLPGKAISAGGRLLGGGNSTPAATPAPAAAPGPAPAAAPAVDPQRRNYL